MLNFGDFELDIASYQLRRQGVLVNVEPQVLDVITYLAQHADRLIRKEELLDEVWGDRFVSESALTSRIKSARQALGDDGRTQGMIRTVHGRGYQFVPFVTDSEALPEPSAQYSVDAPDRTEPTGDVTSLSDAHEAVARAEWRAARTIFAEVGVGGLAAEDLERWGDSAWWDCEMAECIAVRQEAFRRYAADGDDRAAARVAIALSEDYLHRGSSTVAMTWLERASGLLAATPDCRETGQLMRLQSTYQLELANEPEEALAINVALRELAEAIDDPDLMVQAMQDHGRILLALGQVERGMSIIDRSMLIGATTGTTPNVRGRLYCNMLSACVALGDFKRAQDWNDEAMTWCAAQNQSPFPGVCEVHRAGLRRRSGELAPTLTDLESIASTSQFSNITGSAMLEIGEIHRQRGDFDSANDAYLAAHAHGVDATAGLALVAIERGDAGDAVELLRDALEARSSDQVARRQLLPTLVEAAAVAGEVDAARDASRELTELTDGRSDVCRACAATAVGTVALLEGSYQDASDAMRRSIRLYGTVPMPYELAAARLGLAAAAHALGTTQMASLERDAALAAYRSLGAVPSGTARLWLERTADST